MKDTNPEEDICILAITLLNVNTILLLIQIFYTMFFGINTVSFPTSS
jgi:hypothetical protein